MNLLEQTRRTMARFESRGESWEREASIGAWVRNTRCCKARDVNMALILPNYSKGKANEMD